MFQIRRADPTPSPGAMTLAGDDMRHPASITSSVGEGPLPPLHGQIAAVDDQIVPVHVAGALRGEEQDRLGDLVGVTEPG